MHTENKIGNRIKKICLVSCVSRKQDGRHAAAELYTSDWFVKARSLVQALDAPWFILSARHGLLAPQEEIQAYDKTLNKMSSAQRRDWAEKVISQMQSRLPPADEVVLFAGMKYRQHLLAWLESRFHKVSLPMEGMKIGQQLQWLKKELARRG